MLPLNTERDHRDTLTPVTTTPTSISNTKRKRRLSSSSISNSSDQCTGMGDVSVSIERDDIDDIFGDV